MYGAIGTMEVARQTHHLFRGTYPPIEPAAIGAKVFLMAPWDPAVRRAAKRWLAAVAKNPARLFRPIRLQSYGIIQAPDIQPDGRADMCDSCPDMTYFDGKLINSCRMDEYRLFGGMLSVVDRARLATAETPVPEEGASN